MDVYQPQTFIQIWMKVDGGGNFIHNWMFCTNFSRNLDVFSLPLLKHICTHPNLDVSGLPVLECISRQMFQVFQYWNVCLPVLECISRHPNLDVSGLPVLECISRHPNLDVSGLPVLECISRHPNLDVSGLPILERISRHPNLDVSGLPVLECISRHPNLDVSGLPVLKWSNNIQIRMFLVFQYWNEAITSKIGCFYSSSIGMYLYTSKFGCLWSSSIGMHLLVSVSNFNQVKLYVSRNKFQEDEYVGIVKSYLNMAKIVRACDPHFECSMVSWLYVFISHALANVKAF